MKDMEEFYNMNERDFLFLISNDKDQMFQRKMKNITKISLF